MSPIGGSTRLALESSGTVGSVALSSGPDVLARLFLDEPRAQAALMVPAVDDVLAHAGFDRKEVDEVVVGAGPGSFTGVRVAAAVAKGLARAWDVPLVALSSLAGAALTDRALPRGVGPWEPEEPVPDPSPERWVLFDARGERVFAAAYRLSEEGIERLREPHFSVVPDVVSATREGGADLCGDGALRHRATLEGEGLRVLPAPAGLPSADGLLLLRTTGPAVEPLADPGSWEPDYLRATGAERELGEASS